MEAPTIRRLFASSPRDPRYHMLEHLSSKFREAPRPEIREARAAIILNRFSRELPIMFSTNAVASILGVSSDELQGKSFYECIEENCLPEAIRCLESAKANDSIAYLRFRYRDPRRPEDQDERMSDAQSHSSDSEDGGVQIDHRSPSEQRDHHSPSDQIMDEQDSIPSDSHGSSGVRIGSQSRTSSGVSTDAERDSAEVMFDRSQPARSSSSSLALPSPDEAREGQGQLQHLAQAPPGPIELEAVVSCTSDGLVVILRRARPIVPAAIPLPQYNNGFFAAPWGVNPIRPHAFAEPQHAYQPNFMPGLQAAHQHITAGGPPMQDFMQSIREVAVFAWSLTGINGNIASYSRGKPVGQATPPGGFPIWDPRSNNQWLGPENQAVPKWSEWEKTNLPNDGNRVPFTHHTPQQRLEGYYHDDHYMGAMSGHEMDNAAFGQNPDLLNTRHNWRYGSSHSSGPTPPDQRPNNEQGDQNSHPGANTRGTSGGSHSNRHLWQ
jgi:hypothetical protein